RAEVEALVHDRRRRSREAGEREEMRVLVVVELQRPRDRVEHLGGRVDVPSLLEPRVPRHPDTRELRDLLAPEPGRSAPARVPYADVVGLDALSAAPQERSELAAAELRVGRRR